MTYSNTENYDTIYQTWKTNTDRDFWTNLYHIHKDIPCRKHKCNFIQRALDFTNTNVIERSIVDCFSSFSFRDNTHNDYHGGYGSFLPDFLVTKADGSKTTAELKMVKHLGVVSSIDNWHNANIRFVYDQDTETLYKFRRDKALVPIEKFVLSKPLLKYKDANYFNMITEHKKNMYFDKLMMNDMP